MKFDPTDQELIEHLEAKVEAKDMKSHPLIDEFIPTIEGEDGICYTHPEKLPGRELNFIFNIIIQRKIFIVFLSFLGFVMTFQESHCLTLTVCYT